MARFPEEWLNELLSKNDIVSVVGSYVQLQKRGARFWAKCPWHPDSNPSFSVIPEKQIFYCFSCKKGGSVIQFIMDTERLSYIEAVEFLAARVGMEVPDAPGDNDYRERKEQRKRLYELNRAAAKHFRENLLSPDGAAAMEYLTKRGVSGQITPFGLGYSQDSFSDLTTHLTGLGFHMKDIVDAGLAKKGEHGYYDMFRGRVMFPIINVIGEVIGFGGRIMEKGEPKYLNSPETPVFNKRKNLYSLNTVKKTSKGKSILLVEGYMDVIGLAAAGINTAVASLGTSLTKEQARLIKKYTDRVFLSYDGDTPGINAALKGVDILLAEDLEVSVISLPGGQDPDEFVRAHGSAAYYREANKALPGTAFKLARLRDGFDIKNPDDAVRYCTKAIELLKELPNAVERERYLHGLSGETGISIESLSAQLGSAPAERYNIPVNEQNFKKPAVNAEGKLLALILDEPELSGELELEESDFEDESYGKMFFFIRTRVKKGIQVSVAEVVSEFASAEGLGELASAESIPAAERSDAVHALERLVQTASLSRQKNSLLKQVMEAKGEERQLLLRKIDELTRKMRSCRMGNGGAEKR